MAGKSDSLVGPIQKNEIYQKIQAYNGSQGDVLLAKIVKLNGSSFYTKEELIKIKGFLNKGSQIQVDTVAPSIPKDGKAIVGNIQFPFTYSWFLRQHSFHAGDIVKLVNALREIYPNEYKNINEDSISELINDMGLKNNAA